MPSVTAVRSIMGWSNGVIPLVPSLVTYRRPSHFHEVLAYGVRRNVIKVFPSLAVRPGARHVHRAPGRGA